MGGLFDRASIIANFGREGVSWQTILIGNKKRPKKPVAWSLQNNENHEIHCCLTLTRFWRRSSSCSALCNVAQDIYIIIRRIVSEQLGTLQITHSGAILT